VRLLAALVAAAALTAGVPTVAAADDLIVRYKPGTSLDERASLRGFGTAEPLPAGHMEVVEDADRRTLARLRASDDVLDVERDARVKRHVVPNDRLFGQQYDHPLLGTPAAWDVTTGVPGVVVGVVDSGVDLDHPDLRPNLWRNPREVAGNGRDDDRNGYVDDVNGYDWAQHDGTPADVDGHGSHVAGIIGASGNDGFGVAGVAWRASLLPLRVLNSSGEGDVSDAIKAYGYALKAGARVINVSWGGPTFTRAERDMIAAAQNVLFVASAGNEGVSNDRTPTYPCNYDLPNVICVAATDQNDALAEFSNRGARAVDLAAPGVSIPSTIPGPDWALEDGTSMAAPHVAGAAALMLSRAPNATAAQVREALLGTVEPKPTLAGQTATGGRLNVAAAVQAIGAYAAGAAGATPPPRATARSDARPPKVRIVSATPRRSLTRALQRGLRTRVRCSEACAVMVELTASHDGETLVLASGRATRSRAGTATVVLRFPRATRRELRAGTRLRATLRARATDLAGNVGGAKRRVTYRR
jgi:subtilisin family serine protease